MTHQRFQSVLSFRSCAARSGVGCSKVSFLRMRFPSSKTIIVGALATPSTVSVSSRRRIQLVRTTSLPLAVATRTVTGMRNVSGTTYLIPVLSALSVSRCVCLTTRVTRRVSGLYDDVTVSSGYPAPYTHSSQNQSRFSPVASRIA